MNHHVPLHPLKPRLLSEQLEDLKTTFAGRSATLREVLEALQGRAYTLLMIVFALPFLLPVSIPGSSILLGIVIAGIAAQLAFGRLPWLPHRVMEARLPQGFFCRLVPLTARIVRRLEKVLHPRWPAWTSSATIRGVHLLTIVASGVILALPIFVPFTNVFPGWAVLLLACGLLERDGIFLLFGHIAFLATLVFFALLGAAASEGMARFWTWMGW